MRSLRVSDFPPILGLDAETSIRAIYRETMAPRAKLLEVFLSVLRREGREIGPVGRAHLELADLRAMLYEQTARRLKSAFPDAVPLKGAGIAGRYPNGIVRGSVDLDFYMPTPQQVWQAATLVSSMAPIGEANVSIRRSSAGYDLFVGLTWDCVQSALDPIYRVEISTLPFLGDRRAVPARSGVPKTPAIRDLMLVAEEQFQRPTIGRDVVDAAVLLDGLGGAGPATDLATRWRLAPELRDLCLAVDRFGLCESGMATKLSHSLASPAAEETKLRLTTDEPQPALEYGLALGPDSNTDDGELIEYDFGTVLRSPIGMYLLVDSLEVDPMVYLDACTALGIEPNLEAL